MGSAHRSATEVSQALLDKPATRRQGVGMSRLLTDEEVSCRMAGWRDGNAIDESSGAIGARAKERV